MKSFSESLAYKGLNQVSPLALQVISSYNSTSQQSWIDRHSTPACAECLGRPLPSLRDKCNVALPEKMVPVCMEGRHTPAFGEAEPRKKEEVLEDE